MVYLWVRSYGYSFTGNNNMYSMGYNIGIILQVLALVIGTIAVCLDILQVDRRI